MEGRFGPYLTDGTTNATLPKTADPAALTLESALALLAERAAKGPAKGKKRAAPKKAPVKKAPVKKAVVKGPAAKASR
jgi:DNA topoisomerase-1